MSFFVFFSTSSWVPSLGFDKGGAKFHVFSFFLVVFAMPSLTLGRRGACSLFSFLFLLLLKCHCQDLAEIELAASQIGER